MEPAKKMARWKTLNDRLASTERQVMTTVGVGSILHEKRLALLALPIFGMYFRERSNEASLCKPCLTIIEAIEA